MLPRGWAGVLSIASSPFLMASSCVGGADDAARVAMRQGDDAARAIRYGDDLARAIDAAPAIAAARATTRIESTVDDLAPNEEVRAALRGLVWDVGCDVVTGNIPATTDDVAQWLLVRAAEFALQFTDDAEAVVAQALLDAGFDDGDSGAAEACSRLPDSGL